MKSTKKFKIWVFTFCLLSLMSFFYPASIKADYAFDAVNYTNDPVLSQTYPDFSGTKLVYTESIPGKGATRNLKLFDLTNNNKYTINEVPDQVADFSSKIDANRVVYTALVGEYSQVIVADVSNPATPVYHQITTTSTDKSSVDISGNNVVYVSIDQGTHVSNVLFADITDIENPVHYPLTINASDLEYYDDLSVSGRNVSWTKQNVTLEVVYVNIADPLLPVGPFTINSTEEQYSGRFDGNNLVYVEINNEGTTATFKRRIFGGATNVIATKSCADSCSFLSINISGNNVVYTNDDAVYVNQIGGGHEQRVTSSSGLTPIGTTISDNQVFWDGLSESNDRDVFGTGLLGSSPNSSIYRFWSDVYRGHFYTSNSAERDYIIANYPENVWKYEGASFGGYSSPAFSRLPVYRFWSDTYKHHFFTISEAEKNLVIATDPNWNYEGIAYYAYSSPQPNSASLYRFWSDGYRGHFYTASEAEKNNIIANLPEWRFEGVAYYVP